MENNQVVVWLSDDTISPVVVVVLYSSIFSDGAPLVMCFSFPHFSPWQQQQQPKQFSFVWCLFTSIEHQQPTTTKFLFFCKSAIFPLASSKQLLFPFFAQQPTTELLKSCVNIEVTLSSFLWVPWQRE